MESADLPLNDVARAAQAEAKARLDAWARSLVERKAWVMHLPTEVVAQAARYWDGDTAETTYIGSNGAAVTVPVLGMAPPMQHTFAAVEQAFIELEEREARFYVAVAGALAEALRKAAEQAAAAGMLMPTAVALMLAGLRAQQAMLNATMAATQPPPGAGEEPPGG